MALESKLGRIVLPLLGILVGGLVLYKEFFNPSPPTETGNRAYDDGAELGGWIFIACGAAILGYSVFALFVALASKSNADKPAAKQGK